MRFDHFKILFHRVEMRFSLAKYSNVGMHTQKSSTSVLKYFLKYENTVLLEVSIHYIKYFLIGFRDRHSCTGVLRD